MLTIVWSLCVHRQDVYWALGRIPLGIMIMSCLYFKVFSLSIFCFDFIMRYVLRIEKGSEISHDTLLDSTQRRHFSFLELHKNEKEDMPPSSIYLGITVPPNALPWWNASCADMHESTQLDYIASGIRLSKHAVAELLTLIHSEQAPAWRGLLQGWVHRTRSKSVFVGEKRRRRDTVGCGNLYSSPRNTASGVRWLCKIMELSSNRPSEPPIIWDFHGF